MSGSARTSAYSRAILRRQSSKVNDIRTPLTTVRPAISIIRPSYAGRVSAAAAAPLAVDRETSAGVTATHRTPGITYRYQDRRVLWQR